MLVLEYSRIGLRSISEYLNGIRKTDDLSAQTSDLVIVVYEFKRVQIYRPINATYVSQNMTPSVHGTNLEKSGWSALYLKNESRSFACC